MDLTEQQLKFIMEPHYAVVSVPHPRTGLPHLTPVWCVWFEGRLYTSTMKRSAKARFIHDGGDNVGYCILPSAGYPYLSFTGKAIVRTKYEFDKFKTVAELLAGKYRPESIEETVAGIMGDDRVLIELSPSKVFGGVK